MADRRSDYHSYPPAVMNSSMAHHAAGSGLGDSSGSSRPPTAPSKPTYSKRGKITIVACVPCRKRKTKCDGRRPSCSQCKLRDDDCDYDMKEEQRRLTHLRENVVSLAEENSAFEKLLGNLRNSSEDEAFKILRRIREGADLHSLVNQNHAELPPVSVGPLSETLQQLINAIIVSPPAETDDIVQRLKRGEQPEHILQSAMDLDSQSPNVMNSATAATPEHTHQVYHARPMAGNSLAPPLATSLDLEFGRDTPSNPRESGWTQVTDDKEFIEHLFNVYFMWQHAFFQNFPEPLFRQDYESGNTRYCSRVLVNAICAAGCLLSDRPESRGDQNDPTTAGAGFFDEGMRLLNQSSHSSIPTTAGVFLLSHVEGSRAHLGAMWGLVGRSARMAIDLGLHLRNDRQSFRDMTVEGKKHETGRIHAFWGCFISDQVTSMTLGRLPQLLTNAVTVELPPTNDEEDNAPWGPSSSPARNRPGARAMTFRQCAALSKIVNSTLLMFYAPSQIIKGSLLLDEYTKYRTWYSKLPEMLALVEHAPAHVLSLHLYYHAAVLLLFRPFIRAKFTESTLVPSELCRQAATAISELFARQLEMYGTTGLYTFQIQCLLAACTIHLINLPAISSTTALGRAIDAFHKLVTHNTWALGSLKLLKDLVVKWKIILPGELDELLYKAHLDLPQSLRERFDDPAAPQADGARGSKRAAFLNSSSQVMQKRQRLAPVHAPKSAARASSYGREASSSSSEHEPRPAQAASAAAEKQTTDSKPILFSPFPNQPAPLLGPVHTSLSVDEDWSEEMLRVALDFDGLKFEGDGWFDPFIGF